MTKTAINSFRQHLLELKQRLGGDLTALENEALRGLGGEASGGISNLPFHPADLGTDNYEEQIALSLLENSAHIIEEIGAALERMDKGTFGRCEECGQEIARKRLDVLPYTRYCVRDARVVQGRPGQ